MDPLWPPANIGAHAAATHEDVDSAGPPRGPLPFPTPDIRRARRRVTVSLASALETAYVASLGANGTIDRAYRSVKVFRGDGGGSLARNGTLRLCLPLSPTDETDDRGETIFRTTHELVVVKAIDKSRSGAEEAGRREAAAMQHVRPDGNRHVLSSVEALEDTQYIFIIMPYCDGGDIFSWLWADDSPAQLFVPSPEREAVVRRYFRQMLLCLHHLQSEGICHGDISPENVMIRDGHCILIDLDTCLRVPRPGNDPARRLLVEPRVLSAKDPYMAPEIFLNRIPDDVRERRRQRAGGGANFPDPPPFDGFATDLWTLGTTLYVMLTRNPEKLYSFPSELVDMRYRDGIYGGNLALRLRAGAGFGFALSEGAVDMLAGMLRHDPVERLTLKQVMVHPWVCDPYVMVL